MVEMDAINKDNKSEGACNLPVRPCQQHSTTTFSCLYMLLFNILCTYAWLNVFYILIQHLIKYNIPDALYHTPWKEIESPLFFAQSLALLEVLHSLLGLVRSSVITTIMQVFSRLQLVWLLFPSVPASRHPIFFFTCITAWACAELLRFPFFAVQQFLQLLNQMKKEGSSLEVPVLLKWLRYSGFTVLYPIGIASEVGCMWWSLSTLREDATYIHYPSPMPNKLNFEMSLYYAYLILLGLYIPGSIQLYGHMLRQRRKYLYGTGGDITMKKEN